MRLNNDQARWYMGKGWGRLTKQLLATKTRKLLLPLLQHPSKTKDLIQGNPYSNGLHKKGAGMPRVVPKKMAWEDSNLVICTTIFSITSKFLWYSEIYSELWILRFRCDGHWQFTPFPIRPFKMDVKHSMIPVNTGGIRENNRLDLVINCCTTLDDSILQETHVNLSHVHDIRKLWDGHVIILPGKTQTCGVLVLAKRTAPPIEQIITDPAGIYMFYSKSKNTTDSVLALYAPLWNNEAAAHRQTNVYKKN